MGRPRRAMESVGGICLRRVRRGRPRLIEPRLMRSAVRRDQRPDPRRDRSAFWRGTPSAAIVLPSGAVVDREPPAHTGSTSSVSAGEGAPLGRGRNAAGQRANRRESTGRPLRPAASDVARLGPARTGPTTGRQRRTFASAAEANACSHGSTELQGSHVHGILWTIRPCSTFLAKEVTDPSTWRCCTGYPRRANGSAGLFGRWTVCFRCCGRGQAWFALPTTSLQGLWEVEPSDLVPA